MLTVILAPIKAKPYRLIPLEHCYLSIAPVGIRPRPHGAGSGSHGGVVRRRRLGLVAARGPSTGPLLAAAGRRGLRKHVRKVHAPYRRGIGLRSAATEERRAIVGGDGVVKASSYRTFA